jgi:surfeit locus 1 family protein
MTHLNPSNSRPVAASGNSRAANLAAVIAVIFAVALFTSAGIWQSHRAQYKDELKAKVEIALRAAPIELPTLMVRAEDLEFRSVHLRGAWVAEKTIFIDNKIRDGVVGYDVVAPLRIGDSNQHVLVNRGWIAAPSLRSELPGVTTPAGTVEINGIARAPSNRFLELSPQSKEGEQGRVWQNLTIERFRVWSGLTLQPTVIYQQNASDDKLMRVSVAPEATGLSADRHRGYALTWFGLAAVTLVLAVAAKLKSK